MSKYSRQLLVLALALGYNQASFCYPEEVVKRPEEPRNEATRQDEVQRLKEHQQRERSELANHIKTIERARGKNTDRAEKAHQKIQDLTGQDFRDVSVNDIKTEVNSARENKHAEDMNQLLTEHENERQQASQAQSSLENEFIGPFEKPASELTPAERVARARARFGSGRESAPAPARRELTEARKSELRDQAKAQREARAQREAEAQEQKEAETQAQREAEAKTQQERIKKGTSIVRNRLRAEIERAKTELENDPEGMLGDLGNQLENTDTINQQKVNPSELEQLRDAHQDAVTALEEYRKSPKRSGWEKFLQVLEEFFDIPAFKKFFKTDKIKALDSAVKESKENYQAKEGDVKQQAQSVIEDMGNPTKASYKALGLPEGSPAAKVDAAFKELKEQAESEGNQADIQNLQDAYDIIQDPNSEVAKNAQLERKAQLKEHLRQLRGSEPYNKPQVVEDLAERYLESIRESGHEQISPESAEKLRNMVKTLNESLAPDKALRVDFSKDIDGEGNLRGNLADVKFVVTKREVRPIADAERTFGIDLTNPEVTPSVIKARFEQKADAITKSKMSAQAKEEARRSLERDRDALLNAKRKGLTRDPGGYHDTFKSQQEKKAYEKQVNDALSELNISANANADQLDTAYAKRQRAIERSNVNNPDAEKTAMEQLDNAYKVVQRELTRKERATRRASQNESDSLSGGLGELRRDDSVGYQRAQDRAARNNFDQYDAGAEFTTGLKDLGSETEDSELGSLFDDYQRPKSQAEIDKESEQAKQSGTQRAEQQIKGKSAAEILGVSKNATPREIIRTYREEIVKYHPDKLASKNPEEKAFGERMSKALNSARDMLLKK